MISIKQRKFLKCWDALVDVLEGTIRSGKSHIGVRKFLLKVADSNEKYFILAARDKQTAERNLIPLIEKQFGNIATYKAIAEGGAQVKFDTHNGIKIVYVVGFEDKSRWKVILGSTLGGGFIDEANLASMEFLREYFGRLATVDRPYTCLTLNPDDPEKDVYKEFIDRARAVTEKDVPSSILKKQKERKPIDKWLYWHFTFRDNPLMTLDKINRVIETYLPGTIYYKTKILGLRARAENLVFGKLPKGVIITRKDLETSIRPVFIRLTAAVDTSYSKKTEDTNSFGFGGITQNGEYIKLASISLNNKDVGETFHINGKRFVLPLAASDVCELAYEFLEVNNKKYSQRHCRCSDVVIDSPATALEFDKIRRTRGWSYNVTDANKLKLKVKKIDRIKFINSWLATKKYLILEECDDHIRELENYSYDEKGAPEDKGDHTIDETCYEWIPYRDKIGI